MTFQPIALTRKRIIRSNTLKLGIKLGAAVFSSEVIF